MLVGIGSPVLLASIGLLFSSRVSAKCECGYTTNLSGVASTVLLTDYAETNFLNISGMQSLPDWRAQVFNKTKTASRGPYGEMFTADDILANSNTSATSGIQLVVGSKIVDGMIPTAEIASNRSDFFYGSYRANIKISRDPGTCAAFYWVCRHARWYFSELES
jgi:hypothetical protein